MASILPCAIWMLNAMETCLVEYNSFKTRIRMDPTIFTLTRYFQLCTLGNTIVDNWNKTPSSFVKYKQWKPPDDQPHKQRLKFALKTPQYWRNSFPTDDDISYNDLPSNEIFATTPAPSCAVPRFKPVSNEKIAAAQSNMHENLHSTTSQRPENGFPDSAPLKSVAIEWDRRVNQGPFL